MFVDLKLLFVDPKPKGSMYDIYIYIYLHEWLILLVNVG